MTRAAGAQAASLATAPGQKAVAVTPHDTNLLAFETVGIYIGGAGNLAVTMAGDSTATPVVFTALPVGAYLPISANRIRATLTTATLIVAVGT
jgi:hypothetical protein